MGRVNRGHMTIFHSGFDIFFPKGSYTMKSTGIFIQDFPVNGFYGRFILVSITDPEVVDMDDTFVAALGRRGHIHSTPRDRTIVYFTWAEPFPGIRMKERLSVYYIHAWDLHTQEARSILCEERRFGILS